MEAREKAQQIKYKDKDLELIIGRITTAVGEGKFSTKFYGISYHSKTIETLRGLGYKVNVDEYSDTVISW